jgi:DnaJ-class molecular chaperone
VDAMTMYDDLKARGAGYCHSCGSVVTPEDLRCNPIQPAPRDCPTCHGAGEIQFNDSRNRDPQCDDSAPCGTCHGEGVIPS